MMAPLEASTVAHSRATGAAPFAGGPASTQDTMEEEFSQELVASVSPPEGHGSLQDKEEQDIDTVTRIHLPADDAQSPSSKSPTDKYSLPKCVIPPPSQLQPIETFVTNAIQSQHQESPDPNHVKGYRGIIEALRKPSDPAMLRLVLISLCTADHGSVLNNLASHPTTHAELTHWIFRFDSTRPMIQNFPQQSSNTDDTQNATVAEEINQLYSNGSMLDAHLHLIVALVSARTVNLSAALSAVWKMLSENIYLESNLTQRLHAMLCTMFRLVPKARTDLYPIIAARFPFWKKDKSIIKWYCVQAFQVLDYLPAIRKQLLELAIDKCLEIDVNIKIKDDGEALVEEEEKDADTQQEQQQQQPDPIQGDDQSAVTTDVNKSSQSAGPAVDEVDVLSDKLDSLLALVLDTLQQGSTDSQHIRELYYEVLPVFESTILTTYKSKFVQYCMFLLCGLEAQVTGDAQAANNNSESDHNNNGNDAEVHNLGEHSILHRDFAAKLLETIMDPYRATLTRQSAACYLASFVSRASYVGAETVCECISALLRWAEAYMNALATNTIRAADAREQSDLHSLFYTVCQAAFYIMCFRGPQALRYYREAVATYELATSRMDSAVTSNDPDTVHPELEHINLSAKRWSTICSHELQPLRFCLESVRSEFLHMAHAYELIQEQILDKLVVDAKRLSTGRVNKKAASSIQTAATLEKQRRTGGVGGLGRGSNPLKSFFPFDPLLLRRSHAFIEPFYNHWQGPVEEEDVLVIDDGVNNEDTAMFELDEDVDGAASDDEEEEDDDGNDGAAIISYQEVRDDDEDDEEDSDTEQQQMHTPDVVQWKESQRKVWTETMKRPRSQSMENGSW